MATKSQKAANKRNSGKSPGPGDTSRTRLNAIRHGLLSKGLTQLDDKEMYDAVLAEQRHQKKPVDLTEDFLVSSLALYIVKWKTCQRLGAEYVTSALNPRIVDTTTESTGLFPKDFVPEPRILDPGIPARLQVDIIDKIVRTYDRYETQISNRYFRCLHELERMQRARQGEKLPPPIVGDFSLHGTPSSSEAADHVPSSERTENPETVPLPRPVSVMQAHSGAARPSLEPERLPDSSSRDSGPPSNKCYSTGSNNANVGKVERLAEGLWQQKQPTPFWRR